MTRQPLLKRRETAPATRRIRFLVPEPEAAALDALLQRARAAGFDVDLGAALADAYGRIAQRLARELGDDDASGEAEPPQEARPLRSGAYAAE